jgi:acyl carrier protein
MQVPTQLFSFEAISEWLIEKIAEALAVAPEIIDVDRPFAEYGLDSLAAVGVTGELEEWMNILVPATLLWDYPTVNEIARFLEVEYYKQNQVCLAVSA